MITYDEKSNTTNILKGLSTIFLYFFVSLYKAVPFDILKIDTNKIPELLKILYNLSVELLMIAIIYFIFQKEINLAIQDIKKNHKAYFEKYFKVYIISLIIMAACNYLINLLGGGSSENETIIRSEFQKFPVYIFVSATFLAPVLEECVFRLSFKAIFKNNILFIIISSLVFGSLHLMGTPLNNLFPLYLLSYSIFGIAFSYMMMKTNNILVSMGFHFMHNGILMAIQTFILIFL
jgi:membrane protease YdiL (CAAX protease family)